MKEDPKQLCMLKCPDVEKLHLRTDIHRQLPCPYCHHHHPYSPPFRLHTANQDGANIVPMYTFHTMENLDFQIYLYSFESDHGMELISSHVCANPAIMISWATILRIKHETFSQHAQQMIQREGFCLELRKDPLRSLRNRLSPTKTVSPSSALLHIQNWNRLNREF